jgi:excisionase family DNA binding protein
MLMTVSDVAEYLQLSDKTILRLVKSGEIPCLKIANQWRFSKPFLEEWIGKQIAGTATEQDLQSNRSESQTKEN